MGRPFKNVSLSADSARAQVEIAENNMPGGRGVVEVDIPTASSFTALMRVTTLNFRKPQDWWAQYRASVVWLRLSTGSEKSVPRRVPRRTFPLTRWHTLERAV